LIAVTSSTRRRLEAVRAEFVLEQAENVVEDFSGTLAAELGEAVGDGPLRGRSRSAASLSSVPAEAIQTLSKASEECAAIRSKSAS
jgi:hypothetical protein